MRMLWQRMAEIYGHRWTSNFGDDAGKGAGYTWARGLAGLTNEQIRAGVDAALASAEPWPPTLPEFRALCLSIPSFATARATVHAKQVTPFLRLMWTHIDGYRFRQADQDASDRLLRNAYELARDHVMRGGALPPEPVAAIATAKQDTGTPASVETAQKHLAELSKLFSSEEV